MYFKKLEIFGFKSFGDKTVLNFEPGITAIVGPNGCGKSNVFDSIRWVLGEQSVKELRGASMEDVIFNGTDRKAPLGFAEVSLTFSNESRTLPVDYDEVTVSRRLFRSGESEYLLNKTPVRLKDIVEIFMGTGVGAEAYSLVQQGKVDLIVSARPEDRRVIFDEASGITKYKSKRREAMNKLQETEDNLLRINDITVEVKRQITSLERQASKARRYKEEFEKLKHLEAKLANLELADINRQQQEVNGGLAAAREQEAKITGELADLNDLIETQNLFLQELEDKINEISSEDIKIDGQIDINNRQIGFNEERLENLRQNEIRSTEKKTQLLERCKQQQAKIEEVNCFLAAIEEMVQKSGSLLQEKRNILDSVTGAIKSANDIIRDEETKILDISTNQVQLKNKLTEVMKEVQGSLARKRRLEMENAKVLNEKTEVDDKFQGICQRISDTSARIMELRQNLEAQNKRLFDLNQELAQQQANIDDLEKKKLFLKSQKEFIEKLAVQYQDMPDPVVEGRFLTTNSPLAHQSGIIGKVKEVLTVDPARLEVFRASFANAPAQLFEIVCETKFVELDPQQISLQIDQLSQQVAELIVAKEDVLARIDAERKALSHIEFDIQEYAKVLSVYEAQKNDVAGESHKLNEELDLVHLELEEVTGLLTTLKQREDDFTRQLDSLTQSLSFCQVRIREEQQRIALKLQEKEEVTVAIAQMETEFASLADKKKGYQENIKVFSEAIDGCLDEIKRIDDELRADVAKSEQFVREIDEILAKIEILKEQKESLRSVLVEQERQKAEVSQKANSLRAQVNSYAEQIEAIKDTLHRLAMHEQEMQFKVKEIKDRLIQSYRIDLDAYNQQAAEAAAAPAEGQPQPVVVEDFPDMEAMRIAIDRMRKRCESFGAVNLVAIEEFDQLRERFEFLTKQQSDLLTAKESLKQTITKINRQTRQMFMDTFTKVSEEFRIYFRMLFGGGEAQLILLDQENVLESGIDIIARPPGKKLQSISLLSGGEKTLTAIALIFGVFKVNPSPFCVLDEIDAALDESNVGRFAYLLKDFAKIAQFIVITHNKKTMANADIMYGITMEETGVSKVVSVKFKSNAEQDAATVRAEEPKEEKTADPAMDSAAAPAAPAAPAEQAAEVATGV